MRQLTYLLTPAAMLTKDTLSMLKLRLLLCCVWAACGPHLARAQTNTLEMYKETLAAGKVTPTVQGIIEYLDKISPTEEMLNNVDGLITQLGAELFRDRKDAQNRLTVLGGLAEAKVKMATKSPDPEVQERARQIMLSYENSEPAALLHTCIRALQVMEAENAVAPILKASPLCSQTYLQEAADDALTSLAGPADEQTLKRALASKLLTTRLVAINAYGAVLGSGKSADLYGFLETEEASLRLAAARAIANLGDRKAIPALLDLMADEDIEIRTTSSRYLRQLTKHDCAYSAYGDVAARTQAVASWVTWLEGEGKTAELHFPIRARIGESYLNGHTLIAMGNGQGGVLELDQQGKEVWSYPFGNCWTAEKLANGNYLLASHSESRIVEVSPEKEVVWEFPSQAMSAIQLPNGNILAATHTGKTAIEIRKADKSIVWRYDATVACFGAYRLANGNTLVAAQGWIRIVTPGKKVVWEYADGEYFYGVQPLPNGNIMVSDHSRGVYELNRNREKIWEFDHNRSTGAFKLPNGNVLIACSDKVFEVTPDKKTVWERPGNNYGSAQR